MDMEGVDIFKTNLFNTTGKTLDALGWDAPFWVAESKAFFLVHIASERPIPIRRSWQYEEHPIVVEWKLAELIEANFRIRFGQQSSQHTGADSSRSAAA